jgi:septum formation protein
MLEAAGLPVEVIAADIDERAIERASGAKAPAEVAAVLAAAKAHAAARLAPDRIVVAADQTLSCAGEILHKPADRLAARRQLEKLRGRSHALHSAVAVTVNAEPAFSCVDTATLAVRPFSDAFLDAYLDTMGEAVTGSVGGYQLEGSGVQLFEKVGGDYFTILGLPLLPLLAYFRQSGVLRD